MNPHTSSLHECFGITLRTKVVALVGGGGKTSLMFALAKELVQHGRRVVTTTTTKIFPPTQDISPCILLAERDATVSELQEKIARYGHVTVGQRIAQTKRKLEGVSEETLGSCAASADHVLVEADGAAGRPLKAPEPWEPVIPAAADLVIPVVGLDCLGEPATEAKVFRLERFLAITGLSEGALIDPEAVATAITHAQGGMKGVSGKAIVVPFLNKVDLLKHPTDVERLAQAIFQKEPLIRRVVVGQLKEDVLVRVLEI